MSEKPDYARGFEAGRKSVLRKNESGCCCFFDEDGEIIELCMAHRECFEKRSGMEHLALERIEALSADIGGDYSKARLFDMAVEIAQSVLPK